MQQPASDRAKSGTKVASTPQEPTPRQRQQSGNDTFLWYIKLTFFLAALGAFTYYFWPWYKLDPVEFKHSHIPSLNSTVFEGQVMTTDDKFRIVKFYAPWCDHCKSMAPRYAELARSNNDDNLEFYQVDCDANKKLCRKASVQGFPDTKIFYKGRIGYSRMGGMNMTELQKFVTNGVEYTKLGYEKQIAEEMANQQDLASPAGKKTSHGSSDEL